VRAGALILLAAVLWCIVPLSARAQDTQVVEASASSATLTGVARSVRRGAWVAVKKPRAQDTQVVEAQDTQVVEESPPSATLTGVARAARRGSWVAVKKPRAQDTQVVEAQDTQVVEESPPSATLTGVARAARRGSWVALKKSRAQDTQVVEEQDTQVVEATPPSATLTGVARAARRGAWVAVKKSRVQADQKVRVPLLGPGSAISAQFYRQSVSYETEYKPGTIVIDTAKRYLYHVEEGGTATRYGVGVGRQGFSWKGVAYIGAKREWPLWTPPPEMREREPWLPLQMPGGVENPLGARAMYLYRDGADTLYRIHGTNQPSTIGQAMSSGCIRMLNSDVEYLYERVQRGDKVVVI
jgi:lipoprotein-anchoring transpeptidase ErfK/SrfK